MTLSRLARYKELIEAAGLTLDKHKNGKHWKLYVSAPDGRKTIFVVAISTADHRADANFKAHLRRFAEDRQQ